MKSSGLSISVTVLLSGFLCGCAQHAWMPGPNAHRTYEETSAQCSMMSRHSGGSYYARGTPEFVGGAMAGAAIGEAIRAQDDFNDCMSANGWIAATARNKREIDAERTKMEIAKNEDIACLAKVRTNPKYTPILARLMDLDSLRFSFSQMADMTVPTEDEAKLFASYADDATKCWSAMVTTVGALEPGMIPRLQQIHGLVSDLELRVIRREISWGEYAKSAQNMAERTATGQLPATPRVQASQ